MAILMNENKMNKMRPRAGKRCSNHGESLPASNKTRLLSVRCRCVCIYVSWSSLGALGVSVSVTVSDIQSSVLQISSGSHRENTRHGRRDPVATWTVWASQPALSYVAKQTWPLVLSWPVYAQISSIWGQEGGKGIPVHTLLKPIIGVVNICISLQNAQKIPKVWERRVSALKAGTDRARSRSHYGPIPSNVIFTGPLV